MPKVTPPRRRSRPQPKEAAAAAKSRRARAWAAARARQATRRTRNPGAVFTGLAALAAATGALALWLGGFHVPLWASVSERAREGALSAGFAVRHIDVRGGVRVSAEDVARTIGVRDEDPIFALDVEAARADLVHLAWVREASVLRLFPDRLVVLLEEHAPIARLDHRGRRALIDDRGELIAGADPARFADLYVLGGDGAAAAAPAIVAALAARPDLAKRVRRLERVGERRWDVTTARGVRIQLPAGAPEEGLARLAALDLSTNALDLDVDVIDLRGAGVVMRARETNQRRGA